MKPSICIIAHNAYGVMTGKDIGHVGGIEVQTPIMARWFAQQGYNVSLVTWDYGQENNEEVDGVRLIKLCGKDEGIPILRFAYPRWSSLVKAMRQADADVYYYNCGDVALGQIVLWAHKNKRKVLYSVANDSDCVRALPALKPQRERIFYRHGLLKADKIVVQTLKQKLLLQEEFGLESTHIPMPCAGFPVTVDAQDKLKRKKKKILWVGRLNPVKRLEWLLDLAERLPEYEFQVAGSANVSNEYDQSLVKRAEDIANVTLLGRTPHSQMGEVFNSVDLLCSTSKYEGFPNVYLEAWSVGLPLVTTFDPDQVVARYGLGYPAADFEDLVAKTKQALKSENWLALSENAKHYFERNHRAEETVTQFEPLVAQLCQDK